MKTDYAGIDYGRGTTNRNVTTGFRFGIIPQNHIMPEALDDVFTHGTDLDYEGYVEDCKSKLRAALSDFFSDHKCTTDNSSPLDRAVNNAFDGVSDYFGDTYPGSDGCTRMRYEQDGYTLLTDSQGDLWVMESSFFTYAQFCSPCAPGACYLSNPLETPSNDNRAYCLGHDWFDGGKAPYPLYSVKTGKRIVAESKQVECEQCQGTGRDTLKRVAKVRKCSEKHLLETLDKDSFPRMNLGTRTFDCLRCHGKGKFETIVESEVEA